MYICAIDQGTTGSRAVLYNESGDVVRQAYREFTQIYPRPGWVEHNPREILETVGETVREVMSGLDTPVEAVGITNQRETTVVWDRTTGEPVYNAIVWQCGRTAPMCADYRYREDEIRRRTGLPVNAYFSATKIRWLLENATFESMDNLLFGTIDTWLIWNLTGGKSHVTDHTNASRTLLYNIHDKTWDTTLLDLFRVPRSMLPDVLPSVGEFGVVESIPELSGVPIVAVAGDQQAALFGQTCFHEGEMKNTYGTGSFMVMNTGDQAVKSSKGLVTTLAVAGDGGPCYAVEGTIFVAGAAVQWLRDELGILENAADSEEIARFLDDNDGVYMVPAFTGLAAPHWNMEARAAIVGLTRGANRRHIIRAALEAMAYQSNDVLSVMEDETGYRADRLMADGGAVANNFLMQFQADIIGRPVTRQKSVESTAQGVAFMAGLHTGVWESSDDLKSLVEIDRTFTPAMTESERARLIDGWRHALRQVLTR